MEYWQAVSQIKLLVCDVDGVLTDGAIILGSGGMEMKAFNSRDGLAMRLAGLNELPVVWLTGRSSEAVTRRAAELQVRVQQGIAEKAAGLRAITADAGVAMEEIAYVGDDLNDLPALRLAGLPIAVADAVPEVLAVAAYVTNAAGGHGAIREVIELILHGQQRWDAAVERFLTFLREAEEGEAHQ